jgi:hypothetical protein
MADVLPALADNFAKIHPLRLFLDHAFQGEPVAGLPLSVSRSLRILPLIALASLSAAPAGARNPNPSRYPLRVHVLASDETHKTPRITAAESVACDTIEDMVSSIDPNPDGPISLTGLSGDPCSLHPEIVAGHLLDLQGEDPEFSGEGRGDLVSPPAGTQALTFRYDNCTRLRVRPGFQSLPARWKKPGQKLEVLIPSDDIPAGDRPLPPIKCSLTVTLHDFVYLLLRNGRLVEVSQADYWKRPALRTLLSGNAPTVQQRLEQFTVPAHPTQ